jgi:PAS domain S-box-containing protein
MADAYKSQKDLGNFKDRFEFLEKVANLSPNLLFVIDLEEQRIIYVNNKVEKLLGHDSGFVMSQGSKIFKRVLHPDDLDRRMKNLEKCRGLKDEEESEVEVRFSTGENWKWFSICEKVFQRNEIGDVTHVIGTAQNIHEQKTGKEKLHEEHRRLKNAQKIGHIGSFERDLPGDIMQGSEEFFNILGTAARPEGMSIDEFYSFVHPEDKETLLTAVDKTHSTGKAFDTITRIIRPDGSVRHIHRRAGIIKDDKGNPVKVYGTIQDITHRIHSELERKKMENLMRSTETLAGTGSYELDLSSNRVYFSDGLFKLFGEEPGTITPSKEWIDQHSHPEDAPVINEIIDRAIREKSTYTYTRRIYHKDGSLRVLEAHGRFVADSPTEPGKIIGIVQDITERKEAEEELLKSETRSRKLLEVLQNAPDAYLVLSKDLHIKMASDAYLQATNASREDIIGEYIFEAFPDNPSNPEATGVKNLKASLDYVLATKKMHRMPIQYYDVRSNDGRFTEKHWSPTNTPVINVKGEVEYIIHRVLDITEVMKEKAAVKGLVSETEMLKTSLEEIKIQAKQLKENRTILQSVFDASPNSIILYKTITNEKGEPEDFEFFMVNEFNYQSLQLPRDLKGKKISEAFPNVHSTGILEEFKKTAVTGKSADFEVWYEGQGLQNWFHFRAAQLGNLLLATAEDITQRKESEKELIQLKEELAQKATDKYRKIINSMDEGFCLLEIIRDESGACVDYRYLETNPVFEAQTGLKNALGKTINEMVPGIENFWKDIYGNVALTGKPIRFEDYAEGMGRWFDVNAFRINSPNEQHVAVMFKDITDRKEAEERKTFLLNLNDAIRPLEDPIRIQETAMQILGIHLEVNRAYYSEVLVDGDTLRERRGYEKDLDPVTGEAKISDFSAEVHRQLQEGKTFVAEDLPKVYELNSKATRKRHFSNIQSLIAVPLVKNGKLAAVVTIQQKSPRSWNSLEVALVEEVCEQIWAAMERAEAEKALRESEQRFRNLVEASALAVWETEPNGKIINDSISWRNFTGQTYEDLMGEGWLNAVHHEDRARAQYQWKQAVAYESNFDSEFRLLGADGKARWTSVKAIPIYDNSGKVYKWSGMNLDIHDRKQAEEALIKAKEEAEAASRAKEDFLSTMSHEIRTPLNAVIGLTNLLLDKNPRKDQEENLNSLSFSAKNLLALINDILDFSKLEAGKAELNITDFDLPLLLTNLQQAHEPLAKDRQTQLQLYIDDQLPNRIAADQLKLSQVLHNLVSNAVKFTEGGKVSISVKLQSVEDEKLWIFFEIEDTGIGISEDKIGHVFEKFTQAESSTVRQYGGTGLGLSITRLLLQLMNSGIKLKSTPGKGSRFFFSLPVKKANKEVTSTMNISSPNLKDLRKIKILLVEDVEINRSIIIQFLQNWWEIKPDEAKNGKEAVELAKVNHYDLILMDIRMPVMDGYEATFEIKKLPGYLDTPVLALTADKNQEVEQLDYATRFSGLLTKPFEPLDLKKKILLHLPVSSNDETETDRKFNSSEDLNVLDLQNREVIMPQVLVKLKKYKESFSTSIREENFEKLKELQNSMNILLKLFGLESVTIKLNAIINTHMEVSEKRNPEEILRKGNDLFERIIKRVQEEIENPSFEISRYVKIAGKNQTILQNLISNSVRSLEAYKEEFTAAAKNKDPESLSNLVHKNTTSMHYIQANRLGSKINEFRTLLETADIDDDDLQKKQKEVPIEFDFIIAGLKALEN